MKKLIVTDPVRICGSDLIGSDIRNFGWEARMYGIWHQGYQFSKIQENRMHGKGVMIRFTRPGCQQNSLVLHTVQVQEWEAVILVIGSSNAMTEATVKNNRSAKCQQLGHRLTGFPRIYQTSSCETWWAPCYGYSPTTTHGGCRYLKTDYQWT